MHNFIPHQLAVTTAQAKKIIRGQGVIIPHNQMGSSAGEHIMMLAPNTARKLLTSYKKGKGMRLALSPAELHQTIAQGRGFKEIFHKISKAAQSVVSHPAGKHLAKYAVDVGSTILGDLASEYIGDEAGKTLGKTVGVAGKMAIDHHSAPPPLQKKGYGVKGSKSKTHKGELNYTTKKGDVVHHIKGHYVKEAAEPYDSESEAVVAGGGLKKGSAAMKAKMAKLRAMRGGKLNLKNLGRQITGGLKTVAHYGIPAAGATLGGIAGSELGPVGSIVGSAGGKYAGEKLASAIGAGVRKRGRPRKVGGNLADVSPAFKQAMRINFNGIDFAKQEVNNAPISQFKTNPRVKPSSTEMTLSPYQSTTSPAMNPFVPTNYQQMGGTSSGYGGRGLYGSGLYGSGLYGSGLF
jgi:hypothetical protein